MDMVRLSRRWQTYAARILVVGSALVVFSIVYLLRLRTAPSSVRQVAEVRRMYFEIMAIVQPSLVVRPPLS